MKAPIAVRGLARRALPFATRSLGSVKGAATEDPVAALTFDDGPHPDHTPEILDVLRSHNAKATFFFIAHRVIDYPDLARQVLREGHEVGLHGLDHLPLPVLTTSQVVNRVLRGRRVLEDVLQTQVSLYRPPYGAQTLRTYLLTRMAGMQVVGWTAICEDWEDISISDIASRAEKRLESGGILLLHDYVEQSVLRPAPTPDFNRSEMLERVLHALRHKGFRYHTVTDLITNWPEHRTLWFWWRDEVEKQKLAEAKRIAMARYEGT